MRKFKQLVEKVLSEGKPRYKTIKDIDKAYADEKDTTPGEFVEYELAIVRYTPAERRLLQKWLDTYYTRNP